MAMENTMIPVLDLSDANHPDKRSQLLQQLHSALFEVGFLYIVNHGVSRVVIDNLTSLLPQLFDLPLDEKKRLSKLNSPHFLGYSGFAEETTLGKQDLREQFDFATELPVVYQDHKRSEPSNGHASHECERDFTKLYWRLRGPNQFPSVELMPPFRKAYLEYHDAMQELSFRFVHLIEEAFQIPIGTFDHFFGQQATETHVDGSQRTFLPPQHRIKLLKYPPADEKVADRQGVGAHKDSSGWLTFLYQVGDEPGLEVMSSTGAWLPVRPIKGSLVVNFGNAFDAATEGAVKATIHRVISPSPTSDVRYSIPFFQGLPLDMTLSEIRAFIPVNIRKLRAQVAGKDDGISSFLDSRWNELGESQLRKWIRSHQDVALKWYGSHAVDYYTAADFVPNETSK